MEISQLASHSSDPTWEKARFRALHTIQPFSTDDIGSRDDSDLTERAKALNRISLEFQTLIGKNAPLSEIESFMRQWEIASSSGHIVQPNILAWFSDTNALRLACANNDPGTVRFLLNKGLPITPSAIIYAASKLKETATINRPT